MELRAKTKRVFELNLLRVAATDSVEETGARVCCCKGWINAPKVSPYKWKKKLNQIHPIITDQSFRSNNKFSKIMLPIHGLMVTSMQSTGQHRLSVNTKWTYSDTGSWKHSRLWVIDCFGFSLPSPGNLSSLAECRGSVHTAKAEHYWWFFSLSHR